MRPRNPTTRRSQLVGDPDRSNWTLFYFRGICLRAIEAMAEGRGGFQEGAGTLSRSAAGAQLSRLFLGRQGHQSRRGVQDAAPRRRSQAERRLYRRQPRLGALQARPLYQEAAAGSSKRRSSSSRPIRSSTITWATPTGAINRQDRSAFPVEPCARHGPGARRFARDPEKDRFGLPDPTTDTAPPSASAQKEGGG